MLTMADKGGRGVGEMLTMADKGGRGVWNPQFLANINWEQTINDSLFDTSFFVSR